jgi:excisionase family DNA binding protein
MSSGERPLNEVRFLTVAEVAAVMGVSKMTVYRLVHSGEFPAIRVGRSFRVPEQAVHDYLAEFAEEELAVGYGLGGHRVGHRVDSPKSAGRPSLVPSAPAARDAKQVPATRDVSLDEHPDLAVIARQAADRGQVVYLTEHGERLAAVVPAEVAVELTALDDHERAELLTELLDAAAARRGLEAIASGEPIVPWEDVKARLEL